MLAVCPSYDMNVFCGIGCFSFDLEWWSLSVAKLTFAYRGLSCPSVRDELVQLKDDRDLVQLIRPSGMSYR